MVTTKLMTAEELAMLPDDGYGYELMRGELRRMPPPGGEHGQFVAEFAFRLRMHVGRLGLGQGIRRGFRFPL